jgi:TolB-like protein/Flp pilus assembly protein TadD
MYCLDDGAALVDGPALMEDPATAILGDTSPSNETPTRAQIYSTDRNAAVAGDTTVPVNSRRPVIKIFVLFACFAAAAGLGVAIYRSFQPAAAGTINSIAVLPFENRSGNTDTDYLSDGLTDSLIFRFSQLPNLKVSPTSSVMHYKGTSEDVAQIAKELDVDAVLSGRLSQIADSLNISVQLVDARTKKVIWAEQYDRKMSDLMATQREIATTLTQKLQLKLSGNETGIAKKYTNNNEAYQLYLKGRYYWAKRSKDEMFKAVDSYKHAIDLDPNFALAYAAMAEVYNSMAKDPDVPPKDAVPFAKTAAARALELDPSLPEAHLALGDSLAIYDWNWTESEREFKRALELDPNIAYIHLAYSGSYLGQTGRLDEAIKEAERALELEPLSLINNSVLVSSYMYARQYDKALAQAHRSYELDSNFPQARLWLGFAYVYSQQYDKAVSLSLEVPADSPNRWLSCAVLGQAYAKMGKRAEAEQQISDLREFSQKRYVRPYYIAAIYAALGDKDKAFAELDRSFDERDTFLSRAKNDPFMDPLRDDPRFKVLLGKLNLN